MSTGLANFVYNVENDGSDEEKEDDVVSFLTKWNNLDLTNTFWTHLKLYALSQIPEVGGCSTTNIIVGNR